MNDSGLSDNRSDSSPPASNSRTGQARQILLSMLVVFPVVRIVLLLSPTSNFDIAGTNIHHLFTGILLLVVAGIPLVLGRGHGHVRKALNLVFGAGLALVLDEWVYLIVTDGSDMSYLTPVSLWGGVVMTALTAVYIWTLSRR